MKTIRQALDNISKEQLSVLMYAFEHGIPQFVKLSDDEFVGIHVEKIKHLKVEQSTENGWAMGRINKDDS